MDANSVTDCRGVFSKDTGSGVEKWTNRETAARDAGTMARPHPRVYPEGPASTSERTQYEPPLGTDSLKRDMVKTPLRMLGTAVVEQLLSTQRREVMASVHAVLSVAFGWAAL